VQCRVPDEEYVAIDGDDVGHRLEGYIVANDVHAVSAFSSEALVDFFAALSSLLEANGHRIIFCAGDSLLSCATRPTPVNLLRELPVGPCNVSIGIGRTPGQAFLALQLAKAKGKNKIVRMQDMTVDDSYELK